MIENDLDADLDNIQVIAITQPSRGIVEIRNNNIYFTPTNWPVGQQIETSFSYKISDGKGREDIGMVNLQGSILGSGGQNQAPVVNAGNDQRISATSANLIGTVTDDDLPNPPASLTNTWTKISGPGTVTFSNVNALSTNVTFSISGNYTLRLTASDSILSSSDDVVITVINEQVSTPQFSPDSGIYPSMQIVTISTQTQGATIRYTVDGSDPTENSVEYNVPLYMTTTMTLKARAYKAGMTASPVVSAHYIINNSGSTSDLVIYAKGTRATGDVTATSICQNGYPNMVVKYDNVEIGRRCLDATYPSGGYSYTIDTANANASKVTIHFTNDFNVVGLEDRNMIIEKIILNGTQTVLPSNLVYTKGQWTPTYGCGLDMERPATYSNRLGCNGYMRLRQL